MRKLLVRGLPFLIVLVTVIELVLYYRYITRLRHTTFEVLVSETQMHEKAELKRLFDPVARNLQIVSQWLQTKMPDLNDAAVFNARLMPVLRELPQISTAMIADTGGRAYTLLRSPEGWLTRRSDAAGDNRVSRWDRWTSASESAESWTDDAGYDARSRPWYRGVVDSASTNRVFWTAPYPFFSTGEPGISAAIKWEQPDDPGRFFVFALDVLLTDISALTLGLTTGDRGKAFILTADGRVIGVPGDPQFEIPATVKASVLTPARDFPVAIVRNAYGAWLGSNRIVRSPFEFESEGENWWVSFSDYSLGEETLWMAVAVPEADLDRRIGGAGYGVPGAIVLTGLIALTVAVLYRRRISGAHVQGQRANDPVSAALAADHMDHSARSEQVRKLIRSGENEHLEFKSSVRWNFKAGRPGKEIEMAWLKTLVAYMNSDGGVLLIGVNDEGEILGLDRDGFTNDDQTLRHVENLVVRHIGSMYCSFIHSRLISVGDKKVLMIVCETARKPAFLSHDKGEDFYIRTGPASRALPTSEVLTYLDTRKRMS